MYADHGCHGSVELGELPAEIQALLSEAPGEWLEFEPATGRVLVRHAQPSAGPDLPMIAGELIQLLSLVPVDLHSEIPGGAFFVHTYDTGQFARLNVERGGVLQLQWARPDFATSSTRAYLGRKETALDPAYQKLDGALSFEADDPEAATAAVVQLADTFEGLYPAGECEAAVQGDLVKIEMENLNLDSHLLITCLKKMARKGSLDGGFTVAAFGREILPEEIVRIVFEDGKILVQHPVLWTDATNIPN